MLQLKNIYKVYETGDLRQTALDGVSLNFRDIEFVAILGQSGSGKTTMLNIVGGLDQYDKGDLIINGKSTKDFKDRDWDTYRNHSIGFVFQSYNLIPHQSVLSNVELALTLSGVSKSERRQRAKEVLAKVGLEQHTHKRPNQLSGGQMQRVAIARALINDPDILLADEPTGALDSETSIQIMELLKEISKDRLIIMVTHNPELAHEYANRIISLRDGSVIDDTNPCEDAEMVRNAVENDREIRKTYMSFKTALSLSINNLRTKKGRTFMTAFAGSIGIIGIAMILSLSSGVNSYIEQVQEDTLSSYPLTIESTTADMSSVMGAFMSKDEEVDHDLDKVYANNMMTDMVKSMTEDMSQNDLAAFKTYLDSEEGNLQEYANGVKYGYNLDLQVFKSDTSQGITQLNPSSIYESMGMQSSSSGPSMYYGTQIWEELLGNEELINAQYEVLAGKMPQEMNEVVLVVNENNEISDTTLYSLGLLDASVFTEQMEKLSRGEMVNIAEILGAVAGSYTYEELLDLNFKVILNSDYYENENGIWVDKREDAIFMSKVLEDSLDIKVVGIIRPKDKDAASITGSIGYTSALTEYVVNGINESKIVKQQKENSEIDVFSGLPFETGDTTSDTTEASGFDMTSLSEDEKAYLATLSEEEIQALMSSMQTESDASYEENMLTLGVADLNDPSRISIYAKDFESKDKIAEIIENYNEERTAAGHEEQAITYTDLTALMMSSITTIINMITYVLVGFVAISLVVSSIMIGIITYISVLERTKEIGILRSIGASKKDISRVFNAETMIIGFVSGTMGIAITLVLNIPINIIIKAVSGVSGISSLPFAAGFVLIFISIILTLIGGIIPSKMASKKDPVEALRSE